MKITINKTTKNLGVSWSIGTTPKSFPEKQGSVRTINRELNRAASLRERTGENMSPINKRFFLNNQEIFHPENGDLRSLFLDLESGHNNEIQVAFRYKALYVSPRGFANESVVYLIDTQNERHLNFAESEIKQSENRKAGESYDAHFVTMPLRWIGRNLHAPCRELPSQTNAELALSMTDAACDEMEP